MSNDDKYEELYRKLENLVNEFTLITNAEEEAEGVPVAHVLLVGCDGYKPEDMGVLIFPANGCQAGWKTAGLIRSADSALNEAASEDDE